MWIVVYIYNCFSIYYTIWITSGPKSNVICDNIPTKNILFFFGCSEVNSTWLITSELVNQRARKVLFTCVVYTNKDYLHYCSCVCCSIKKIRLAKPQQYVFLTSIFGLFSGVIFGLWHALILSMIVNCSLYDLQNKASVHQLIQIDKDL